MSKRLASWVFDHPEVWTSPHRQGGDPCVRGTRVPVETVLRLGLEGATFNGALYMYPAVTAVKLLSLWQALIAKEGKIYE